MSVISKRCSLWCLGTLLPAVDLRMDMRCLYKRIILGILMPVRSPVTYEINKWLSINIENWDCFSWVIVQRNARKFQSRMKTLFSWHSCILTAGLQIYSIRKSWLYWQIFGINLFEINHCSLLFMFRNAPLSPMSGVFYYSECLESSACSKMLFHFNTAFLVFSRITERKHMSLAVFWFPLSIHR